MSTLVFPFHDPNNIEFKYLKQILTILKDNFDNAFVSITPQTQSSNPEALTFLQNDSFFKINLNSKNSSIGNHIFAAYKNAVKYSNPNMVLHLCYIDRLAYALLNYKEIFLKDLENVNNKNSPIIFQRSAKAWETHPANYHAAESMVTHAGNILLDKIFDFSWCHLSLTAKQLDKVLPDIEENSLLICMKLVFFLKDFMKTKDVDWLSWEDPFILEKDLKQYKNEREKDPRETEKRMRYVLPQIEFLFEEYNKINKRNN